jgi:hypothetical protein
MEPKEKLKPEEGTFKEEKEAERRDKTNSVISTQIFHKTTGKIKVNSKYKTTLVALKLLVRKFNRIDKTAPITHSSQPKTCQLEKQRKQ